MKFGKKQLVLASLVLALGAAVYLNWQFAGTGRLPVGDSSSETSQLGAAQLVNNTYVETVNDGAESGGASGDALAQARMDRQNSRDQALELLDGVLEDVDSDSAAKQQAVEEASAIAQNILAESNVESLLEAKGYTDCVAYITAQECSVVLAGAVEEADTLIVQEVVMEQTGLTADKIKIIGTNELASPPKCGIMAPQWAAACGSPVQLENAILCTQRTTRRLTVEAVGFFYLCLGGHHDDKKGS